MQMMDIDKLVPHEKNSYFFDDMSGEAWMAFLESIETSGIIEPIVITESSHVIISGHQRVRAAKHFKMKQVPVTFREDKGEDEILKQLIETNIRQRGIGNVNPIKFGRCIKELERIYGIAHGGDRSSGTNDHLKTQGDLAKELEISKRQMTKYKSLTDLIPELQDAVQSGQITATTAMGFVKKLSPEEQRQLAEQISGKEKVSNKDVSQYVEQIKAASEENERLRKIVSEKEAENVRLKNQKQEVREVIREVKVIPEDYEMVKTDNERLSKERQQYLDEMTEAKEKLREYENPSNERKAQMQLDEDTESFIIGTYNYIKRIGGMVWVTKKMDKLPKDKANEFREAVMAIDAFAKQMIQNIGGYGIE